MGYFIGTAFSTVVEGLSAFVSCFRPSSNEAELRQESIDRYFVRIGGYLVNARNRFEKEYMENANANV